MFLCIDLDAFFVSVEQALNPSLKGKPVIVGALPGERGVVASASYEARKFGIRSGMPIAHAYRLCPEAKFLRPNFGVYELFSKNFREILNSYSPVVEMVSIDEAYINIKGTERLFGPALTLGQKLKEEVANRLKLPTSIGIGRTRIFSKIACDQAKPDGLLLILPDEEEEFLFPLSVDVLPGIGPKSLEILKNLNINTVGELLKTSDWVLNTALGSWYKLLKFSIFNSDYQIHDSIKSISRESTLGKDTRDKKLLSAIFYYLLEQGCATLRNKNFTAQSLTIKIRYADFKTVSRQTKMPATNCQQKIFEYGLPILTELLKEGKRVRLIGIKFSQLEYRLSQPSIFPIKEEPLNRLNQAVDKVRRKFGFNSVFAANTLVLKNANVKLNQR